MDNHSSGDSSNSSISTHSNAASANPSSSTDLNPTSNANGRDQFLRHLNKLSHKISKPALPVSGSIPRRPPSEPPVSLRPPPLAPPLQQQPPVYNISKNDFRDVVQKLTGSPAHDRVQSPVQPAPPIHAPKPASSRLQRIRPPPLAQLSNRPPPMLNCGVPANITPGGGFFRPPAPLSPLPPLPTCHAAAESPISAYMRFLHSSISAVDSDPKFNNHPPAINFPAIPQPPQSMNPPPSSSESMAAFHLPPSSPLPLACLPSPKSPCPLLSPKLLFSPTGTGPLGFPQLPISPTVPGVPSPK